MSRPPLRVLFLTDSLSDLDGVGRYGMRLISAMQELRPELRVRILLARKHRPTSSAVPKDWRVEVALPPDYFFHMSPPRFWASLGLASLRVRRAAREADLVHAIKDYPHSLLGLLAARHAGIPCVATGHGTYTIQPLLSPRHARLARWTYARFAGMLAVSNFTAQRLREILGAAHPLIARLRVVPNAVAAEHYAQPRDVGARPWHSVPFTLSIGELKERKGQHLTLEAWCRVARTRPQLHHFVVGKASDAEYVARLNEIVARERLTERVHFLGNVSEDEKVDLLQRARVFVHTPVVSADGGFEGFGIVYLEAAASGTPAIGTLGCGAEDAIVDGQTGLLVAPQAEDVERALARLLDDGELHARMRVAAREHAARRTWRDNAEAVLRMYDEVRA
jgi:phosphatidylinositol alpha-1,6-mannosyltransferase